MHRFESSRNRHVTEDLRQAAVVRVLARARRAGTVLSRSYVATSARHVVIDHIRCTRRRAGQMERNQVCVPRPQAVPGADRALLDRRVRYAIEQELARLPPERRQVLSLYLSGHGISEIAQTLGWRRKKVDNMVYRGLNALRRELAAQGLTPSCY